MASALQALRFGHTYQTNPLCRCYKYVTFYTRFKWEADIGQGAGHVPLKMVEVRVGLWVPTPSSMGHLWGMCGPPVGTGPAS